MIIAKTATSFSQSYGVVEYVFISNKITIISMSFDTPDHTCTRLSVDLI